MMDQFKIWAKEKLELEFFEMGNDLNRQGKEIAQRLLRFFDVGGPGTLERVVLLMRSVSTYLAYAPLNVDLFEVDGRETLVKNVQTITQAHFSAMTKLPNFEGNDYPLQVGLGIFQELLENQIFWKLIKSRVRATG